MLGTLVGGAVGLLGTIVGVLVTQILQRQSARDAQILDARVRVLGECTEALYEYERVNFTRAVARLSGRPDEHREALRQEAYRCETRARSAIGQATFLSGSERLEDRFESVRAAVRGLNDASDRADLDRRHDDIQGTLKGVLRDARSELSK